MEKGHVGDEAVQRLSSELAQMRVELKAERRATRQLINFAQQQQLEIMWSILLADAWRALLQGHRWVDALHYHALQQPLQPV